MVVLGFYYFCKTYGEVSKIAQGWHEIMVPMKVSSGRNLISQDYLLFVFCKANKIAKQEYSSQACSVLTQGSISVRMSDERWQCLGVFGLLLYIYISFPSLQELTVRH